MFFAESLQRVFLDMQSREFKKVMQKKSGLSFSPR